MAEAKERAENGEIVTVYCLSLTALYHQVFFHADGYWVQKGGLFGKSERNQRMVRWWSKQNRLRFEDQRLGQIRNPGN